MSYDAARRKARREERRAEYAQIDPTVVTKTCLGCNTEKPLVDFNVSLGGKLGRHARCRSCRPGFRRTAPGFEAGVDRQNARRRKEYSLDEEKREARQDANRVWRYGLERGQYRQMLEAQGGVCAICKLPDPAGHGNFHVDHDHSCCPEIRSCGSCIRGLLCTRCNTGLGMFRDSPEIMAAASEYLMAGLTGSGSPNLRANVSRQVPVAGAS